MNNLYRCIQLIRRLLLAPLSLSPCLWSLLALTTAVGNAHGAEAWIDFPKPEGMRAWVSVSDLGAAVLWQTEQGGDDLGDLEPQFGLNKQTLRNLHRAAARCEFLDDQQAFQVLAIRADSPAAAEKLKEQLSHSSSNTTLDETTMAVTGSSVLIANLSAALPLAVKAWETTEKSDVEGEFLQRTLEDLQAAVSDPAFTTAWQVTPARYWQTSDESAANAQRHGLDALTSFRGAAAFTADQLGYAVTQIVAEPPLKSSTAMLELKPVEAIPMPGWLNATGRGGTLLSADLPTTFSHLAAFFDDAFAEGIEGTYREVLSDVQDPQGLGLDLVEALYPRFGDQIFLGTPESSQLEDSRRLIAIKLRGEASDAVAEVVKRMMQDDPEVKREQIEGAPYPLWLYPTDADSQGGMIVVGGYLCLCHEEALLREMLNAQHIEQEEQVIYVPPKQLPFPTDGFAGIVLANEQRPKDSKSKLLSPFFAGFSGTDQANSTPEKANSIDLEFITGDQSGWCFYDAAAWRIVLCDPATFESIVESPQ